MAHTPYGYTIQNGKAVPDKIASLQVKAFFEDYLNGSSLQSAGTKAGISRSHASLGRMIDSPCYKGDDFYPAIISTKLWAKAQEERKRRADGLGRNKNYFAEDKSEVSPFWDMVFCSECGQTFRKYSENRKQRWRCKQRNVGGKVYCNSYMITELEFEEASVKAPRYKSAYEKSHPTYPKKRKKIKQ